MNIFWVIINFLAAAGALAALATLGWVGLVLICVGTVLAGVAWLAKAPAKTEADVEYARRVLRESQAATARARAKLHAAETELAEAEAARYREALERVVITPEQLRGMVYGDGSPENFL